MSRLTYRDEHGTAKLFQETLRRNPHAFAEKLAHYEDLEEAGRLVKLDDSLPARDELDRCTHRHCNNCDKYRLELQLYKDNDKRIKEMTGMDMAEASARFASYMKMKDEGRLIELPCAIGDTVWSIHGGCVSECKVVDMMFIGVMWNDFGKFVFLTKAEAEAKLAELKGDSEER